MRQQNMMCDPDLCYDFVAGLLADDVIFVLMGFIMKMNLSSN